MQTNQQGASSGSSDTHMEPILCQEPRDITSEKRQTQETQHQNVHGDTNHKGCGQSILSKVSEGAHKNFLHKQNSKESTETMTRLKQIENSGKGKLFNTKMGKLKHKKEHQRDNKLNLQDYTNLWHRRLRHISLPAICKLLDDQNYRQIPSPVVLPVCEVCALSKLTEKTYDQYRTPGTRPGEIIYADLIGPITPRTFPHNYRFILSTIDSYTRYAQTFPPKKKSDMKQYLKVLFNRIRAQFPNPGQIRVLRTDQGNEFENMNIKQSLLTYSI